MTQRPEPAPRWDLYAFALIALMTFYQLLQWPLLPRFVDLYYHLGVVKGFADAGGWVARDTWEFAPAGQPHLYPPFLHILLLIPYRFGADPIFLARAVDALSYPALLVSFWFWVRSREGAHTAFWALLVFSGSTSALMTSVTLPAFNLGMIGVLWTFYFLSSGRAAAAILTAAAVCWTHTLAAGILAACLTAGAALLPGLRKKVLQTLIASLALSLPLWLWLFSQKSSFSPVEAGEGAHLDLDLVLYALAALRLVRTLRTGKKDIWPLLLLAGLAPAAFFRAPRVIGGYGLLAASWLAVLEVSSWGQGRALTRRIASAALVLTALAAPSFYWDRQESRLGIQAVDRTWVRYLFPSMASASRVRGFSIYFEKEYAEILDVLKARTQPGDIFWTDFPHAGGILYLYSGRAMSTSMLREVGSWDDRRARLANAKILIWFKNAEGKAAGDAPAIIEALKLKPVAETSLAYIFENPAPPGASRKPEAVIPSGVLWAVLGVWLAALLRAARLKPSPLL